MTLIVALTGGVASGKSAAAERFAELGASVIDADQVTRELVEPGQAALAEIVLAFGAGILNTDGSLARRRLRELVFADPEKRRALERILHPRVRAVLRERANKARGAYCILAIPLLAESGDYEWVDRVLVVDLPEDIQLQRLCARDRIGIELARQMLAVQASRQQRLQLADDVLDNSGDPAALREAVDKLHFRYLALAARQSN